ncbi:MAG: hypothetical protein ACI86P_001615, partial [Flavobacteriales bacterium]
GTASVTYTDVTAGNCPVVITRTFTAIDACGNTSNATQLIIIEDTTDPEFVNLPAIDIFVECDDVPDASMMSATDNCDTDVTITFSDDFFSGGCLGVIQRTWIATDDCENATTFIQFVHLEDNTDPVLTGVPADNTYECDETIPDAMVTATDNCDDDLDFNMTESVTPGSCPQESVIVRTWTATDDCDNTVTAIQTINIVDTTPPVVVVPTEQENITCEEADVPTAQAYLAGLLTPAEQAAYDQYLADLFIQFNLLPLSVTDNCDPNVDWIHFLTIDFDVECPIVAELTCNFYAVDACGNVSDTVVTIANVIDVEAPELLGVPADVTVECGNVPDPSMDVSGTDDCNGPVAISMSEVIGTGCPYTVTRTWTATDECNNSTTASQVITVTDNSDPVLIGTLPANETVQCDNIPDPATLTAEDACDDDVIVNYNESSTPGACADAYTLTRTWNATDDCNNTVTHTQIITVIDTTDPVFVNLPDTDIFVECDDIPEAGSLTATDNCDDNVEITFDDGLFSGGCAGVIERTWTATDNCSNSVSFIQYVHLVDETDPVLSELPADVTADCSSVPGAATLTAVDNCDTDVEVLFDEILSPGACPGSYTIFRTWTATDDCGNTAEHMQTVTITDIVDPEFEGILPGDLTVECDMIPDAATLTATDLCGTAVVTMEENTSSTTCPSTLTRVWTATDECDNVSIHTQVLTINDTTDPVLSTTPSDVTAECDAIPMAAILTATDNCDDDVSVVFNESSDPVSCNYVITRTWTAIDNCMNQVVVTQLVTVEDSTAPTFDAGTTPSDSTVECDAIPEPANPTASDNCQETTVSFAETTTTLDCGSVIERTWTATDGCGNNVTHTQTITVVDNTDPVLSNVSADESYECGEDIPDAIAPTATDNCDSDVTVTFEETSVGNDNPNLACELATPVNNVNDADIWAVWMPTLPGSDGNFVLSGSPQFYEVDLGGGILEAHMVATVHDPINVDRIWEIDLYFIDKKNWSEWSSSETIIGDPINRSFKDDFGWAAAGGNLWESWDYWLVDGTRATLTGAGDYAGSELTLSHAPANLYFGFQVGQAANNRNDAFGLSGWFSYSGNFLGNTINGVGDFGMEADCPSCDYTITRVWTAEDDCGNMAVATQIIEVSSPFLGPTIIDDSNVTEESDDVVESEESKVSEGAILSYPNPTKGESNVVFNIPADDANVVLELFNLNGERMEILYTGNVKGGVKGTVQHNVNFLSPGVYTYKLTTSTNIYVSKLVVTN